MKAANLIRRIQIYLFYGAPLELIRHLVTQLEECIAEYFEGVGD